MATWNVNSVVARLPRLHAWLEQTEPDVVCLQEIKCSTATFPTAGIEERGYQVVAHGDGRWNGVAVLTRVGADDITRGFPGQPGYAAPPDPAAPSLLDVAEEPVVEARALGVTCGPLRVWSVYVPNGRTPDSAHYAYKLEWLAALRGALAGELTRETPTIVAGDFNVAPTDADVWDPSLFVGSTHATAPERDALAALRDLGLRDVVPRALKHGTPYTYWDYRGGSFHKNEGMRIDLVYASAAAADHVTDAYVDRDARKGSKPSDHAPVVVDLDL